MVNVSTQIYRLLCCIDFGIVFVVVYPLFSFYFTVYSIKISNDMFFSIVVDVVNACGGEGDGVSTILALRSLYNTVRVGFIIHSE